MNSSDGNKLTSRRNGRSTTSISWYSFWKYSKVGRIEERSGIWTRWIFDKKTGRKSVQRLRLCTQWIYISRSKSTSVISSSSWTRRIANSRLQIAAKHMGYAWYIGKRFCKSTSVLFDNLFRNAQSLDFSITGNIPVQASTGRPVIENGDRDNSHSRAPKMAKKPTQFLNFPFYFFWFLKRPSTEIPTLCQKKSQEVSGFSETLLGKFLRKGSRGKTVCAVHLKNNLNRSAGLNGNCTTPSSGEFSNKCAWMHHQTDELSSRSEKWLKFSGNLECAWQLVKNASGRRAAEVFMETTEEHKVLSPNRHAKVHESHTITKKKKKSIAWENWSNRASWRGGHVPKFAMRQQRKDESPKYKEAQRICFSAPYWEKCWAASRAHCTI